jgi:hypothetical protein
MFIHLFITHQRISNIFSFGINICMNQYIATVRIHGRLVRTRIWADEPLHAKLLLQYYFGMGSIAAGPVLGEGNHSHLPYAEQLRIHEAAIDPIKPAKPRSPEQAQIDGLKARKDQAAQALKAAQQRQRVVKAQRVLQTAIKPLRIR